MEKISLCSEKKQYNKNLIEYSNSGYYNEWPR